jgi:hypothetical protein
MPPPESRAERRGHPFYPLPADLTQIPVLYSTDDQLPDEKIIWVHYFAIGTDWLVAELDPADEWLAFTYARRGGDEGEWGYVSLVHLERVFSSPLLIVERDLFWTPKPARDCVPYYRS